jgi:hypothetical protein
MSKQSAGASLFGLAITACSTQVNLYPVQGPLASQRPLPVVTAEADGILGNTGNLKMTMPTGEVCAGKWASAAPQMGAVSTTSLFGQYGSITGMSVMSGPAPGVNRGEAFLTCTQGTTVQAEFFTGSGTANGYGIAKDSNGNVFKMIF